MTTYVEDSEGKFIPASQRPDGTWRKARRVKDGYIPQEEVPLYESKGKLFAKKPSLPVGMCPTVAQALKDQRLKKEQTKQQTTSNTSNAKISTVANNKQNRIPGIINLKPNKHEQSNNIIKSNSSSSSSSSNSVDTKKVQPKSKESTIVKADTNTSTTTTTSVNDVAQMLASTNLDPQIELAKKLKKLRKKIREIEQIEGKIKSGELKNPEKDQIDKVGRKPSILKELDDLEKLVPAEMLIPNQTNGGINN